MNKLIVLSSLLSSLPCFADNFTHYTTADGLGSNYISSIYSSNGDILTAGGQSVSILKSGTKNIKTYTIDDDSNNLNYVAEDSYGTIYTVKNYQFCNPSCKEGVEILKKGETKFTLYSDGLPSSIFSMLYSYVTDNGDFYTFIYPNIYVLKNGETKFTSIDGSSLNNISSLYVDNQNNIYVGSSSKNNSDHYLSILKADSTQFITYTSDNGLKPSPSNGIQEIFVDKNKNIYINYHPSQRCEMGGYSNNIYVLKNGSNRFFSYSAADGLNGNICSIFVDNNENIYATTEKEILILKQGDSQFTSYLSFDSGMGIGTSYIDNDLNISVGDSNGLYVHSATPIQSRFKNYSLPNSINLVARGNNGDIYFTAKDYSNKGIIYILKKGDAQPNILNATGLKSTDFNALYCDNSGNLYLGSSTGLSILKAGSSQFINYTTTDGLGDNHISSISLDNLGDIFVGTLPYGTGGLSELKVGQNHFMNYTIADGLPSNWISSLYTDKNNNVYIGTDSGLSILNSSIHQFTNYSMANGIADNYIQDVKTNQQGDIYLATKSGLSVLGLGQNQFTTYTTANGLASNDVISIAIDNSDNVYMGTNGTSNPQPGTNGSGLSVLNLTTNKFSVYTTADGLGSNNINSIDIDSLGNVYTGTVLGLSELINPTTWLFKK
jgi:hypothetical protein